MDSQEKIKAGLQEKLEEAQIFNANKDSIISMLDEVDANMSDLTITDHINDIKRNLNTFNRSDKDKLLINTLNDQIKLTLKESKNYKENPSTASKTTVTADIFVFNNLFRLIGDGSHGFHYVLKDYLDNYYIEIAKELTDFRKDRGVLENFKAEDFYSKAVEKYKELEDKYRKYFYIAISIVLVLAVIVFLIKNILMNGPLKFSIYDVWALKITIILVGITLISYFLKQSVHYQKLADQNYQTQVELQAYPEYIKSIPTSEAASIRKELALKYFGREIDATPHKDMANLISDQMKNTTEMVKAATDALKSKGGS